MFIIYMDHAFHTKVIRNTSHCILKEIIWRFQVAPAPTVILWFSVSPQGVRDKVVSFVLWVCYIEY
jgi:hypothetical protein